MPYLTDIGTRDTVLSDPNVGFKHNITFFRELAVTERRMLLGYTPSSPLDTNVWTKTEVNNGTVALDGGFTLTATGDSGSEATLTTIKRAHFHISSANWFAAGVRLPDSGATAGLRRRFGMFDASNGVFFEQLGTTLYAMSRLNGVDVVLANLGPALNDNRSHLVEIHYTQASALFYVDRILRHFAGTLVGGFITSHNIHMKMRAECSRLSGSGGSLFMPGMAAGRFGAIEPANLHYRINSAATSVVKTGPGALRRIIIGAKGSGGATLTIYDNTAGSGTVLAVLDNTNQQGEINYDITFDTGLTIVSTGTPGDITIIYT